MLPKPNRLTDKFEFNVARKHGEYIKAKTFHMYVLKARNYVGPCKVGFVISNKFDKSAVLRNRVKRLFREAVQKNLGILPANTWVVIHPKFFTKDSGYEEISTDVTKALQKIFVA